MSIYSLTIQNFTNIYKMKQNKIYIYEYIGTEPLEHSLQMLVSKKAQLNAI